VPINRNRHKYRTLKIADSVLIPTMLEMNIIKKKNEANTHIYKFQSENDKFQILAFKSKEILEAMVPFNLGITRQAR
jgi:hypothetical protein